MGNLLFTEALVNYKDEDMKSDANYVFAYRSIQVAPYINLFMGNQDKITKETKSIIEFMKNNLTECKTINKRHPDFYNYYANEVLSLEKFCGDNISNIYIYNTMLHYDYTLLRYENNVLHTVITFDIVDYNEDYYYLYVHALCVNQEKKFKGGGLIMGLMIDLCAHLNIKKIKLSAMPTKNTILFYLKYGFKVNEKNLNDYIEGNNTLLEMSNDVSNYRKNKSAIKKQNYESFFDGLQVKPETKEVDIIDNEITLTIPESVIEKSLSHEKLTIKKSTQKKLQNKKSKLRNKTQKNKKLQNKTKRN